VGFCCGFGFWGLPIGRISVIVFLRATGFPPRHTKGTDKMSKRRNKTRNSSEPSLLELFAITVVMLSVSGILIAGALINGY